jgi:hypothetical protein
VKSENKFSLEVLLKKHYLEKECLQTLYVENCLSVRQIARRMGCSPMTVQRALVRYGIERRSLREGQLLRRNGHYRSSSLLEKDEPEYDEYALDDFIEALKAERKNIAV